MAYYVCSGAKLKCSMGSKQSELEVVHLTERVLLCGKPMANIIDSKPMVNIKPFGQCSSMANPAVAAATSANYGRLQKMPCIPNIPFPWLNGKMNLIIKGSQALLSTSKCTCVWAATIEVADPGQSTVREDCPMNITITEPTVETQQALGRGLLSSQDGVASSSQAPQSSSSATQSSSSSSSPSSASAAQGSGWKLSIEEIEGAAETYPRQKIAYKVTKYNKERNEISDEEKKEIKWAVKVGEGDNNIIELKDIGEKIILDIDPVWEYKDILVMAYLDNYSETVSQKTKVLEDPYKGTLIRGVVGGDEASVGQDVKYEVINSNKDGSASEVKEGSDVKWAIKVGKDGIIDKTILGGERGKKTIVLRMKEEWLDKKEITIMPYLNSPTETVSVKTIVEKWALPKYFAKSKKEPGYEADGISVSPDMTYLDMTKEEVVKINNLFIYQKEASKETLFTDMSILVKSASFMSEGGLENSKKMIEHFKSNRGTEFVSSFLDNALANHPSLQKFLYDKDGVIEILKQQLKNENGNINQLKTQEAVINSFRVKFNEIEDMFNGKKIAIDDTHAYKIYITEYELLDSNKFKATLLIEIYDHFGLDIEDIDKFGYLAGIRAWFVLQHVHGYKPFITKMTYKCKISDTF